MKQKLPPDRILKLATDGVTVKQIAARFGVSDSMVYRLIERSEAAGKVPAGTLAKCGAGQKTRVAEPVPENVFQVYAPQRKVAADMGSCSACKSPTEIAVDAKQGHTVSRIKLCVSHASDLYVALGEAMVKAASGRVAFNGKFKS